LVDLFDQTRGRQLRKSADARGEHQDRRHLPLLERQRLVRMAMLVVVPGVVMGRMFMVGVVMVVSMVGLAGMRRFGVFVVRIFAVPMLIMVMVGMLVSLVVMVGMLVFVSVFIHFLGVAGTLQGMAVFVGVFVMVDVPGRGMIVGMFMLAFMGMLVLVR